MDKRKILLGISILMFLIIISTTSAHAIPESSFFKLNEGLLSGTANNTANNKNGSLVGAINSGATGLILNAINSSTAASSSTNRLESASLIPYNGTNVKSIVTWVRVGTGTVGTGAFFSANQTLCATGRMQLNMNLETDRNVSFWIGKCGVSNNNPARSTIGVGTNTWTMLTQIYYGNTTTQGYINATAQLQTLDSQILNAQAVSGFYIGSAGGIDMKIDGVREYDFALTPANITFLYNGGVGTELPLGEVITIPAIATVNQTFPSNNSQFNFSSNLYFWVTSNVTINNLNTTLFVDGVNTQSKLTANGNDVLTNFTGINFTNGVHTFYIQYKNDTTTINTTTNTFFVDLVFPAITSTLVNNSIYYTSNFTQFFSFQDDQMLSSYNITLNGVSIYSNYSLVTNYSNVTVNQALSNGANTLQVRVADGHTKDKIDTSAYTKHDNDDYLQFTKANKQFKIYEKGNNAEDIFTATAGYDRYTFDYTPKIVKSSYTFIVESTDNIRIVDLPNSPYKKWLIVGDNWIDFYMDDQPFTIDIVQKNKKATEVTISGFTNGNKLRFKSIGELNILTATYSLFKVNTTQTFTTPTLETKTETYTLNITREATQSSTAFLRYNASDYNATKTTYTTYDEYLTSLVVPFTSVNVSISNGLWNFTVNNSVSNLNTTFGFNQTVVQMLINNCTTIIGNNAVNWTIRDDSTEATVIGNTTGFFTVWYTNSSLTRTFSLAWMNTTSPVICQLPNETLRVTYTVTYGASGYATKHKSSINTPFNWTTIIQTLYLTPGAASVVVNTIDQISNPLVGYLVEMYRFDSSTNNYSLSQSEISDYGGNGLFSYLAANQYKFIIYNTTGDNIYDTGATHIIANPTIIKVGTVGGTDIATPNIEAWSLRTTLYNVSRHVWLNWTTLTGTSGTICLNVSKTNATSTQYLYGACSSSSYGSIDYNVTASDGTINAIAWIKGSTYVTNILSFVINSVTKLWQSMGVSSMLIYIILIMIAIGVSITSVQAMPYAIGIANIVAMWLGVISWSWGFVVVILAALLIIADRVRD